MTGEPAVSRPVTVVAAAVAGGVALDVLAHHAEVSNALLGVRGADRQWLAIAALAVLGLWLAGTATQLGVLRFTPPVRVLFAVQVAASFANSLVPGGVGGMAVNVRFLRRNGLHTRAGVAAAGLNSCAGLLAHLALLVGVAIAVPGRFCEVWRTLPAAVSGHLWPAAAVAAALLTAATATALLRRRGVAPRARGGAVRAELAALRVVLRHPRRALALWTGAAATPLLHCLVLFAVLRSLEVTISPMTAGAVYLTASTVAGLIPAPGGLGTLDVLLAGALVAVGVTGAAAVGAVVAYRLVTVWVPLLPSGCVFALLVRRRII
jgi:uncharacterized membrane protein YbhN (UPF0104 family)